MRRADLRLRNTSESPAQLERRRSIRILSRDLKIMYDGCTDWADVRSPDLSVDGVFINTPHKFGIGARIRLRFQLPVTRINAQADGEVRYCLPGFGIGVEFLNLPDSVRAAIKTELEALESKCCD